MDDKAVIFTSIEQNDRAQLQSVQFRSYNTLCNEQYIYDQQETRLQMAVVDSKDIIHSNEEETLASSTKEEPSISTGDSLKWSVSYQGPGNVIVDRSSSSFMINLNVQSMILGTTTLCIPYACQQAGIYALPLMCLVGMTTSYTAELLQECLYATSKRYGQISGDVHRTFSSYSDLCHAWWPSWGTVLVRTIILSTLARNVAVFILLRRLTVHIISDLSSNGHEKLEGPWWSCVWMVLILILLFTKRISAIAWLSLVGLIPYIVALFAILIYFCTLHTSWKVANISDSWNLQGVAIALGIFINSNSAHLSFPILEGSMRNPKDYKTVIRISFIFNALLKLAFGFLAVLSLGGQIQESVTSSLKHYPILAISVRLAVVLFSYMTIPLQSYVIFDLVDEVFYRQVTVGSCASMIWRLLSRLVLMSLCLIIAIVLPRFGIVVSVIGCVRGILVTLILPCLFHLKLCPNKSISRKLLNSGIVIVSVLGAVLGLYATINVLINPTSNGTK